MEFDRPKPTVYRSNMVFDRPKPTGIPPEYGVKLIFCQESGHDYMSVFFEKTYRALLGLLSDMSS